MYQCTGGAAWQAQATTGATGTADFTAIPNTSCTEEWRALTVVIAPSVSLSNSPTSKDFGLVDESSSYWSTVTNPPTWPLDDAECYFTLTNNGSVSIDISIKATDFSGGVGWTLVTAAPGQNQARLTVWESGDGEGAGIYLTTTDAGSISLKSGS